MKTLTKTLLGAAMLVGGALAVATPAAAQSNFGLYYGNGGYGGSYYGNGGYGGSYYGNGGYGGSYYGNGGHGGSYYGNPYYGDRYGSHSVRPDYRNSRGYGRWDPYLHRRDPMPYRYGYRDRWDGRWDRGHRR